MNFKFKLETSRSAMLKSIRRTLGDSYNSYTKKRCYLMPDGFTGYRLTYKERGFYSLL